MSSKENPLEKLEWYLEVSGMVTRPEKRKLRYTLTSIIGKGYYVFLYFTLVLYVFEDHPLVGKAETFQFIFSLTHLSTKWSNLLIRGPYWRSILDYAIDMWQEMSTLSKDKKILSEIENDLKRGKKAILWLYGGTWSLALTMFLLTVTLTTERKLIFNMWDPVSVVLGPDWYWSRCLYDSMAVGAGLYFSAMAELSVHLPCVIAAGQMKVLAGMLEDDDLDATACVAFHQKIVRYTQMLNEFLSSQMFVEMLCTALQASARGLQLIYALKNREEGIFKGIFFLIICFMGPFIPCYSGELISEMSDKLFQSTYQNRWYDLNTGDKKTLCILMTQASQTIRIRYRGLMAFNMEQFASICQTSYSILTVLIGMTET